MAFTSFFLMNIEPSSVTSILEIEGDTLFVNLLVCLVVDSHILRVLCIEGVILCTYLDVLKLYAIGAVDDDTILSIVYLHIPDVDIAYRHLRETVEVSGTTGCAADDMVDVDIAETRSCLVYLELLYLLALSLIAIVENLNGRLATVIKVEGDDICLNIKHRHVVDIDILYYATTTTGTLEAETYIGAEKLAVAHLDILYTTAHLATYNETAVALEYGTAVYDDILARNAALSSVCILTTLDADTVVAYIESRVDDECILAALQVETITILSV